MRRSTRQEVVAVERSLNCRCADQTPPPTPPHKGEGRGKSYLGRFFLRLDFGEIVGAERLHDVADFEFPRADLADGRHFGRGADDEALLEALEFVRHDGALDNLDLAAAGKVDDRAARDAIEEAIGNR